METNSTSTNAAIPPRPVPRQTHRGLEQDRVTRQNMNPAVETSPGALVQRQVRTARLYWMMIGLCLVGMGATVVLKGWQKYLVWDQAHSLGSVLDAVQARERQFFDANRAFTGSRQELRLKLPEEIVGRTELAAAFYGDTPGYRVEYCHDGECELGIQTGERLKPVQLTALTAHVSLPELSEGPPRLLTASPQSAR